MQSVATFQQVLSIRFHTIGLHFQNHISLNGKMVQQLPSWAVWIEFEIIFPCICRWLINLSQDPKASLSDFWEPLFPAMPRIMLSGAAGWRRGKKKKPPRVWSHSIWKKEVCLGPGSLPWLHIWHEKHLCDWRIDWLLDIYWALTGGLVLDIHEHIDTFSPQPETRHLKVLPKELCKMLLTWSRLFIF